MKRLWGITGFGLLFFVLSLGSVWPASPPEQERSEGEHVVVRYARSEEATAGRVAKEAAHLVEENREWGRGAQADRLTVVVGSRPASGGAEASARAVAPFVVTVTPGQGDASDTAGLEEAVALALTQPPGSPAFTVDWLHEGMGSLLAQGFTIFPEHLAGGSPAEMLAALNKPGTPAYRSAAANLAGLVMDRWGIDWTTHYQRKPAELTPGAMLQWASGRKTEGEALAYWQERLDVVYRPGRKTYKLGDTLWVPTAADLSPVRLSPVLDRLPGGPGPNDNYSPHQYTLDVRWEPERRLITGDMTLTWENGEGIPVDTLYFHLWPNAEQFALYGGRMTIGSVQVDGRAAPYTARALDLTVPLGRRVEPGQRATVAITFETRLPGIITEKGFGQEETSRFVLTHWYPTLAVLDERGWNMHGFASMVAETYSENSHFTVRLDLPAGTVIGATGHVTSKQHGKDRWVYEYDAPNVKDWVAVGGTDLKEEVRTMGGVTVHLIDSDDQWMEMTYSLTEQAFEHYTERFGAYPYRDLVVSSVAGGMEWPGLFFTNPLPTTNAQFDRYVYVTMHELAHQWFYGLIGNDQYHEPWLDEGFTTYADRSAGRALFYADYWDISRRTDLGPLPATASQYELIQDGHSSVPYQRGAQVLEDLEKEVGRPTMDKLMQEWVRRYAHKTATTADFVALATEVTGQDLTKFFEVHRVSTERQVYRPLLPLGQATFAP